MARFAHLEPGVLPVFRLFMAGQWLVLGLALWSAMTRRQTLPDALAVVGWVSATAVLAYLAWGSVQRRLGRAYLPIALGVITLGPVIALPASVAWRMQHGLPGSAAQVNPSLLYLWLLLPLALVSTQYGLRALFVFALGTMLLTSIAATILAARGGPPAAPAVQDAVTRAILFSIVGGMIVMLSQAQRRQREMLARQALTLEYLTVSRERNRLVRELHDTLAHTLSAVSVQLAALEASWEADPVNARHLAHQAHDLTRNGLDEVRRALHALRASPVEALGLAAALQRLAAEAAARAGVALTCALSAPLPTMPLEVEQQCYRIVEEALNNVVRHAHAHRLQVTCQPRGRALDLVVADDGQGFDATHAPPAGHYGITGMRERATLIGATFAVQSRPQQGTTIVLTWPGERTTR